MKNLWLVVAALLVFVAPASATREHGNRIFEWRPGRLSPVSAGDVSKVHPTPTPTPGRLDVSKREPTPTPTPGLSRNKRAAASWRPGRFSIVSSVDIFDRNPKPESTVDPILLDILEGNLKPKPTFGPILLDEEVVREPGVKYNQPLFERFLGKIYKNPALEGTAGETEDQQYPF